MLRCRGRARAGRRGTAAVELAFLLPLLAFLFVIGVDFGRCFYHYVIVTNCARNGAAYAGSHPDYAANAAGIQAAALADAANLSPPPTVTSTTSTDADGNPCARVTVSWTFRTITNFPGVPSEVVVTRTVQTRIAPTIPRNS
jgi:Flp pilus assembly protein TadG